MINKNDKQYIVKGGVDLHDNFSALLRLHFTKSGENIIAFTWGYWSRPDVKRWNTRYKINVQLLEIKGNDG